MKINLFTRNLLLGAGSIKLLPTLEFKEEVAFALKEAKARAKIENISLEEAEFLNFKERLLGQLLGFSFLLLCIFMSLSFALLGYSVVSIGLSVMQLLCYLKVIIYTSKEKSFFVRNVS
jgi:hypothetical protein